MWRLSGNQLGAVSTGPPGSSCRGEPEGYGTIITGPMLSTASFEPSGEKLNPPLVGPCPELFRLTALQRPDPQLAAAVECQCLAIGMKSGGSDSLIYFLRSAARGGDGPQAAAGNVVNAGAIGRPERESAILICLGELHGIRCADRFREDLHEAVNARGVSDALAVRRPLRRTLLGLRSGERRKLVSR